MLPQGALQPGGRVAAARACAAIGLLAIARTALDGDVAVAFAGLAIAAGAWIYSAPPVRLLARGLGELDTVLVVAVLVPAAGYASLAHAFGTHVLIAALPGAFAMFAMMLSVEIPDAAADAATGKRNLVVRWGVESAAIAARTFASGAVLLLLLAGNAGFGAPAPAFLALVPVAVVAWAFAVPHYVAHLPFVSLPFLGVALYGSTACAGIVLVLAASI